MFDDLNRSKQWHCRTFLGSQTEKKTVHHSSKPQAKFRKCIKSRAKTEVSSELIQSNYLLWLLNSLLSPIVGGGVHQMLICATTQNYCAMTPAKQKSSQAITNLLQASTIENSTLISSQFT